MRRLWGIFLICALVCLSYGQAGAQIVSMGRSSSDVPLSQIKTREYRLIFPVDYTEQAIRTGWLLDSVRPYISTGIGSPPRALPIIMRTQSVLSNGFVTWAPKREELIMMPATDMYALSWSKQLAIHEWRHVTQISALNHGLTKVFSWLLGEAAYGLGLFPVGQWVLEGDATLAETQFAEYGRGLQPDFTVGYRTLFAAGRRSFRYMDPWVCGSYNRPYPSMYHFGYQVTSWADTNLGSEYMGSVLRYTGTWPIFVFSPDIRLKRKYKTTFHRIAQKAFAELDSLWKPYSEVDENFEMLTSPLKRNYTQYQYPMALDGGGVAAFKSDWNRAQRLVAIDTAARRERRLSYVGQLTSRPERRGSTIYWTEYKPHPVYEQESFSLIRSFDISSGKREAYERWGRHFFVTPTGDDGGFAAVSYDPQMRAYIQFFDSKFTQTRRHQFAEREISLHGLAYDTVSGMLAYIALAEQGMWIGAIDGQGRERKITRPSVVSVSDLTAADGRLYFSSIESGKNEVHSIDLAGRTEHQLSYSRFGSAAPRGAGGDTTLLITKRADGDMIARAVVATDTARRVDWSRMPQNKLNPTRREWDVPKLDSITVSDTTAAREMTAKGHRVKRYRRASQFFNLHSWAPLSIDPTNLTNIASERNFSFPLGVTAMFQSPLSDFDGYATYGYINERSLVKGAFSYRGLPVVIGVQAEYGGGDRLVYGGFAELPMPATTPYFGASLTLSMPLSFSGFHSSRRLLTAVTAQYSNSLLWSNLRGQYDMGGYVYYDAAVEWSSSRLRAYRALTSRLGYSVQAGVRGAFDGRFSTMYRLSARGYLPAIAATHSIALRAAGQYQARKYLTFTSKVLVPRGYTDNGGTTLYGAASVEYFAPIAYPDWGWDGVLFLKRIWGSAFFDGSGGDYTMGETRTERRYAYSCGVNVGLDFTLIRAYDQGIKLTFAQPSGGQKLFFGFSYSLGF